MQNKHDTLEQFHQKILIFSFLIEYTLIGKKCFCSIDYKFISPEVNVYKKFTESVKGEINFRVFTKIFRWKQQTARPIGKAWSSKCLMNCFPQIKIKLIKRSDKIMVK